MSVPSFRTEDDEAAYWLALLRDGDEAAKIAARDGLARIFALRGRWSEVAELCALQIEHGVCTPQMYERLAAANFKAGNTDTMQSTHADANGKHRRLRSHGAAPEPPAPSANVAHLTVGNYEPTGPALPRHSGPDRSLSARLSGPVVRLVMIVLIFGVGNLLLVGGQKVMHWKDQSRLDEMNRQLDTDKVEIARLESELRNADSVLTNLDANLNAQEASIRDVRGRIDTLGSDIDIFEHRSAGSTMTGTYGQYSQMVAEHNELVDQHALMVRKYNHDAQEYNDRLSRFQTDSRTYDDKIGRYNALVTEGNGLAKTIGTTWFIVPAPRFGAHGHQAAPVHR